MLFLIKGKALKTRSKRLRNRILLIRLLSTTPKKVLKK